MNPAQLIAQLKTSKDESRPQDDARDAGKRSGKRHRIPEGRIRGHDEEDKEERGGKMRQRAGEARNS